MTTADYLTQLQQDREDLVDNLEAKGITGLSGDETFTELVPEVLNIPSGGGKYAPRYISFYAYKGTELNDEINNLDIKNLTRLQNFFTSCINLTTLNIGDWDTSKMESMNGCFNNCNTLTSLDLHNWTLSGIQWDTSSNNINYMFSGCISLQHLDIRNFDFSNAIFYAQLFGVNTNTNIPDNCEIIVKDNTQKQWINTNFSRLTNVKTVAQYEGS